MPVEMLRVLIATEIRHAPVSDTTWAATSRTTSSRASSSAGRMLRSRNEGIWRFGMTTMCVSNEGRV